MNKASNPQIDCNLFYLIAENTMNGMILTNNKKEIIYVNKAFTYSTGYSSEEVLGETPKILQSGLHDHHFYKELWSTVNKTGHWQGEIWNRRKNGELFSEWQNIMALKDEQDQVTNYAAIFSDTTERKMVELEMIKRNTELEQMAMSDALTGLPNRYMLTAELSSAWNSAIKSNTPISLLILDIDHFKLYNDTYGHVAGDHCLAKVAAIIGDTLAKRGFLTARYGGEEFIALLPGVDIQGTVEPAEEVVKAVEAARIPHKTSLTSEYITISCGCASLIPEPLENSEWFIKRADRALYRAKENGRNRISF